MYVRRDPRSAKTKTSIKCLNGNSLSGHVESNFCTLEGAGLGHPAIIIGMELDSASELDLIIVKVCDYWVNR